MPIMTIDEIIRYKLGESIQFSTQALEMARDEVARAIMEYCHIGSIPDGLIFTWANMTVDLMRYQYEITKQSAASDKGAETVVTGDVGAVKSIKIGDTSLTFDAPTAGTTGATGTGSAASAAALDDLLLNYHYQLLAYRRIKR